MDLILLIALALTWIGILVEAWLIYLLLRQHGRILLQQDELRGRLLSLEKRLQDSAAPNTAAQIANATEGLAIGSSAPTFVLPDLDGHERTLAEFLDRSSLLVIFFDPACSFCARMAPRLAAARQNGTRVLLISRGDAQANQKLSADHQWKCDVVLDRGWEIAQAFHTHATPTGYLLDAHGRITTPLLIGADALLQFILPESVTEEKQAGEELTMARLKEKEQAVADKARNSGLSIRESKLNRNGLSAGTVAPNFSLPDLNGATHSLDEFRGSRVLLIFSASDCSSCMAFAPELEPLSQKYLKDNVRLVMISRGDLEANRAKAKECGFTFPVLMQRNWEVSKEYALFATPIAYLIDEQGIITREVAIGANAIRQLV